MTVDEVLAEYTNGDQLGNMSQDRLIAIIRNMACELAFLQEEEE